MDSHQSLMTSSEAADLQSRKTVNLMSGCPTNRKILFESNQSHSQNKMLFSGKKTICEFTNIYSDADRQFTIYFRCEVIQFCIDLLLLITGYVSMLKVVGRVVEECRVH
ncbi:unnamed protein product [Arctogadus glacialis]